MIYPKFPENNATIGVCAPSAGIGYKEESYNNSIAAICRSGYNVKETLSVRNDSNPSADSITRGNEFNSLIEDPDVDMIIAAAGGDYNIDMLQYTNASSLISHPKWVMGASDPTNILYYMTTKLDIATLYGQNAGSFDWSPLHKSQENCLDLIGGILHEQSSYEKYAGSREFINGKPDFDTEVYWTVLSPADINYDTAKKHSLNDVNGYREADKVDISGRLIGGCADCIQNLIGTPYDGASEFVSRYRHDGIIWYFDPFKMDAADLYRLITQMKYAEYFDGTRLMIFGRVMFTEGSEDFEYISLLAKALRDLGGNGIPFIWNADIGHVKPSMTLINGAFANVVTNNGKGRISMKLI